jgi:lipid II:glycine glycyltransferase (peptidoglycan interpeptide bridge formation enzyme)
MAVQPPNNGDYISALLEQSGFSLSTLELAPTASLVLDLSEGKEAIIKGFHHKIRQCLRQSEKSGIRVTQGTYEDLDIFYNLHLCTARRHKFTPYKREYFNLLWQNLAPSGWIKMFIAWNSEPLSAMLVIPFGDTVIAKMCGWDGKQYNSRPNEAMHWEAITWGIDHGYRYFDFEGIDPSLARHMLSGEKLSTSQFGFKVGFGGKPVVYPPAYDLLPNQLFNWFYRRVPPVMYGDSVVSQTLEQFRKR